MLAAVRDATGAEARVPLIRMSSILDARAERGRVILRCVPADAVAGAMRVGACGQARRLYATRECVCGSMHDFVSRQPVAGRACCRWVTMRRMEDPGLAAGVARERLRGSGPPVLMRLLAS